MQMENTTKLNIQQEKYTKSFTEQNKHRKNDIRFHKMRFPDNSGMDKMQKAHWESLKYEK